MATTIGVQPNTIANLTNTGAIHPIYDPKALYFTVASNTSNIYIIRAKITFTGGDTVTIDHEYTIDSPFLGLYAFVFDFKNIVRDYVTHKLHSTAITIGAATETFIQIAVEFTEITKDVNGVITVAGAPATTSNTVICINAARQYDQDVVETFQENYVFGDPPVQNYKWATDSVQYKRIGTDEQETGAILRNFPVQAGDTYSLSVTQYDGSTIISTDILDISAADYQDDIGIGTRNLAAWGLTIDPATVVYWVTPVFYDSSTTTYYFGETRFLVIDEPHCDHVRFHFQNTFGRFDSFTMNAGKRESMEVKSERFQEALPPTFSVGDRGYAEMRTVAQEVQTAYLDFVPREVLRTLMNFYRSPQVFVEEQDEDGNAKMIPVIIMQKEALEIDSEEPKQAKVKFFKAYDLMVQQN